jgi:hypothetical protein
MTQLHVKTGVSHHFLRANAGYSRSTEFDFGSAAGQCLHGCGRTDARHRILHRSRVQ